MFLLVCLMDYQGVSQSYDFRNNCQCQTQGHNYYWKGPASEIDNSQRIIKSLRNQPVLGPQKLRFLRCKRFPLTFTPTQKSKISFQDCEHPILCAVLSRFSRVRLSVTLRTVACGLLCLWDSLGKNSGVGCHALLHGQVSLKVDINDETT